MSAVAGGFLGVEVFFVISGYLITALLLAEWSSSGRISLRRFWFRRARRLLPALFVVLLGTLAFAVAFLPDEVARLRADAAAAAAYVSNWYLVVGEHSYFETAERQSPLLHLWSLAVEEQFYVLWPVVLAVGLAVARRRGMLVLTVGAAIASAAWMAALFDPAVDPSRIYYGTDTRLSGLLLGAALAFVWVPRATTDPQPPVESDDVPSTHSRVGSPGRWSGVGADAAVVIGAVGLAAAFVALDGATAALYRGGFLLVDVATIALIAGAVHPAGRLGRRVLDWAPLRWLGTRSYSVYLWHWPVFMVTRPELDVALDGAPLLAVRLGATAVLAELSYRLVEQPIRRGAIGRAWKAWREEAWRAAPGTRSPVRTRATVMTAAAALSVSGLLATVVVASPPERPSYLPVDHVTGVIVGTSPTPAAGDPRTPAPRPSASAPAPTLAPTPAPTPAPPQGVLAVGDSMLVATAPTLADALGTVEVDASIGRQVDEGIDILAQRQKAGTLPAVVVLNLGVNGPLSGAQFERAMETLRGVERVVWVTVKVPRPWEEQTNRVLAKYVPRYPSAMLVDWYGATKGRKDLFWKDGYHPRPEGAKLYAKLITEAVLAGSPTRSVAER